jgi:hypothetical protein
VPAPGVKAVACAFVGTFVNIRPPGVKVGGLVTFTKVDVTVGVALAVGVLLGVKVIVGGSVGDAVQVAGSEGTT